MMPPPGLQIYFGLVGSYDLDPWPPGFQSWPFHAVVPWITCVRWHQNRFICF